MLHCFEHRSFCETATPIVCVRGGGKGGGGVLSLMSFLQKAKTSIRRLIGELIYLALCGAVVMSMIYVDAERSFHRKNRISVKPRAANVR